MEAGFDPDRFWSQTPRLYRVALEAKGRAAETDHRHRAWLAWTIASLSAYGFHAPAKIPTLESLTATKPKVTIQTPEQMRAAFASWRRAGEKIGGARGNS